MGLGEMLGMKYTELELKGDYATLEDLFEAINNVKFEAGIPKLTKHGIRSVIVFPPIDRNNQVWITGEKGKFNVMRSAEVAGLGNLAINSALDALSGGWTSISNIVGNSKNRCLELVDITAREIKESDV